RGDLDILGPCLIGTECGKHTRTHTDVPFADSLGNIASVRIPRLSAQYLIFGSASVCGQDVGHVTTACGRRGVGGNHKTTLSDLGRCQRVVTPDSVHWSSSSRVTGTCVCPRSKAATTRWCPFPRVSFPG